MTEEKRENYGFNGSSVTESVWLKAGKNGSLIGSIRKKVEGKDEYSYANIIVPAKNVPKGFSVDEPNGAPVKMEFDYFTSAKEWQGKKSENRIVTRMVVLDKDADLSNKGKETFNGYLNYANVRTENLATGSAAVTGVDVEGNKVKSYVNVKMVGKALAAFKGLEAEDDASLSVTVSGFWSASSPNPNGEEKYGKMEFVATEVEKMEVAQSYDSENSKSDPKKSAPKKAAPKKAEPVIEDDLEEDFPF